MSDLTARNIAIIAVAAFLIVMAVMLTDIWGVATPVHAAFGWTVDSIYWVHIVDSVRTDSSGKLYSVTEWPDTNFDLSLGHVHRIRFIYWAPGLDSANWEKTHDYHDYNNANCVGGGAYVVALYVIDTATTPDSGVYYAKVTIKQDSSTGATETWWMTDQNGYVEFALDNGDWSAVASRPGLASSPIDFSIASGPHFDTIFGYVIPTPTPPSIDYATVEGFVVDPSGNKLFGVVVTAARVSELFGTDTTTTPVIIGGTVPSASTDTAGYFSMFLMRTTAYDDSTTGFYDIVGTSPSGAEIFTVKQLYVPSTGNMNLGLIVARR